MVGTYEGLGCPTLLEKGPVGSTECDVLLYDESACPHAVKIVQ